MTVLDAHPYATLVDDDWGGRFGPLTGPLLTLNTADAAGNLWGCPEPAGWGGTEAVTPLDSRQWGDGAYAGATTFRPRTLSFGPGLTVCADREATSAAMALLRGIAQSRAPMLYTQPEHDGDWSLWLRASGAPNLRWVDDTAFEWSFVMVADDPFKFDAAQLALAQVTSLPGQLTGRRYPKLYPKRYQLTTPRGSILAVNRGDEASRVVYGLRGPVTRPTVYSRRTGLSFTIDRVLAANEVVAADTATGEVTLNGVSILDDLIGDLPPVLPGDNLIQWAGALDTDLLGPGNAGAYLSVATTSTRK